jgi:hypothetical protein
LAQRRVERDIGGLAFHLARGNVTTTLALGARARTFACDFARQFVERGLQSLRTKCFADADKVIGGARRRLARFVPGTLRGLLTRFGRLVGGFVSRYPGFFFTSRGMSLF